MAIDYSASEQKLITKAKDELPGVKVLVFGHVYKGFVIGRNNDFPTVVFKAPVPGGEISVHFETTWLNVADSAWHGHKIRYA